MTVGVGVISKTGSGVLAAGMGDTQPARDRRVTKIETSFIMV
jgi:hypothetical protein